jgi:peptide-methionine (S)-S-oxide reductase
MRRFAACLVATMLIFATSCARPAHAAAGARPKPTSDLPAAKDGEARTAVLAGGCFWCVEAAFEQLKGVTDVTSGYAGGTKETANYEQYASGGHVEVVRITYDPHVISYAQLLQVLFTISEPTVKNKQGPDAGPQYRMAVFYANEDERKVAESYIKQLTDAKVFGDQKIETTLDPLKAFYPAETYHQDYVKKNPDHPYVRAWSIPKVEKTRQAFPELVKNK